MKAQTAGPVLSTVFVDYDNIYLSLKRKNEEAAKRFAKDAGLWLREIESGRLITSTSGPSFSMARRIVMNRCYGNPVPRRNANDNSTDMNSFPFVRHHFLRAGFEVIDCPPLTAQLKNSADIRMVMDVRDVLHHETQFDEFIILSGDADFTPVLHRLRAHARRTVVFANDHTAAPYTAISDGEVRDTDLMALLLEGRLPEISSERGAGELRVPPSSAELEAMRKDIVAEVVGSVRAAAQPVPLEALADRAVRALGHEKTVGSAWGGVGSFRDLLSRGLPGDVRLSDQPPYVAFDTSRQLASEPEQRADLQGTLAPAAAAPALGRPSAQSIAQRAPQQSPLATATQIATSAPALQPAPPAQQSDGHPQEAPPQPLRPAQASQPAPRATDTATQLQQSIARIHEACQAPPLSPPEYRVLFEVMAEEINANSLAGAQALTNIAQRALEKGVDIRHDEVRFVLEVVGEADPWFEQGASAALFAGRFRNFVVARCRAQGLSLSADEIDLIAAWFGAGPPAPRAAGPSYPPATAPQQTPAAQLPMPPAPQTAPAPNSWTDGQHADPGRAAGAASDEEFPRILRSRLRG